MRFDGSMNFVNVAYFEGAVLQTLARFQHAKEILAIGNSANDVGVSGEEKVRALARQLREAGGELYFSSPKRRVMSVFEAPNCHPTRCLPAASSKPSNWP